MQHLRPRCHTFAVPTTRPTYSVTDTGRTAELLDLAERAWPEVHDFDVLAGIFSVRSLRLPE